MKLHDAVSGKRPVAEFVAVVVGILVALAAIRARRGDLLKLARAAAALATAQWYAHARLKRNLEELLKNLTPRDQAGAAFQLPRQ